LQSTELREREGGGAAECGGRKEKASGTGRQLLCQVGSSAHYCTSCKQNSCGLTHGEREREALKSPESLGSSIKGI